eukprot:m.38297 g.38297  ORF g.38297 m.38297 type:complete len:144 (+) comp9416_c0_seq1:221-652(+)
MSFHFISYLLAFITLPIRVAFNVLFFRLILLFTEYAQVAKMLGNGRLEALCFDGVKRLCHIRGKLRKKVWINQGDIILVGLRDYQDAKADVILKYNADEARNLKNYGELPESAKINESNTFGDRPEDDDDVTFDDMDGGDDDM